MNKEKNTQIIKSIATQLGFDFCGIALAQHLNDDARRLETWLNKGMNGSMEYMANHFDIRVNPTLLVPGAKSVITVLYNYYPEEKQTEEYKISKYAYGEDYHDVIRKKLHEFFFIINLYKLRYLIKKINIQNIFINHLN
jgi:epoxyqueuosine reductase